MRPKYQQDVIKEKDDLCQRMDRLRAFIDGKVLPNGATFADLPGREQLLMKRQCDEQGALARTLGERIGLFPEPEQGKAIADLIEADHGSLSPEVRAEIEGG